MRCRFLLFVLMLCMTATAQADPALELQTFHSSDEDGFETFKQLAGVDFSRSDAEHYLGVAAQYAHYRGPGFSADYARAYLNYADSHDNDDGTAWKWNTLMGSDGHTWLGNAEIYHERSSAGHDVLRLRCAMRKNT
jgi:hypothetical protein